MSCQMGIRTFFPELTLLEGDSVRRSFSADTHLTDWQTLHQADGTLLGNFLRMLWTFKRL